MLEAFTGSLLSIGSHFGQTSYWLKITPGQDIRANRGLKIEVRTFGEGARRLWDSEALNPAFSAFASELVLLLQEVHWAEKEARIYNICGQVWFAEEIIET